MLFFLCTLALAGCVNSDGDPSSGAPADATTGADRAGPATTAPDVQADDDAAGAPGTGRTADREGDDVAPTPTVDLQALDEPWVTERYNGETGAVRGVLMEGIRQGRFPPDRPADEGTLRFEDIVTSDFKGEDFASIAGEPEGSWSGIAIQRWGERPTGLEADTWAQRFDEYLRGFETIESIETHMWELQLTDPGSAMVGLEGKTALWIVGLTQDGQRREDRMLFVTEYERPADGTAEDWRLTAVRAEEGRTAMSAEVAFEDVTAWALPGGQDQAGSQIYTDGGPVLGDIDSDGDPDLFLARIHAPAKLYLNDGNGRFQDSTESWGLGGPELAEGTHTGLMVDVDSDGRRDLVVAFKELGIRVYRNEGGSLRDRTGPWPLGGSGQWESLAAADADGDGDVDIYATNYNLIDTDHQPESYIDARDGLPNILLINEGGRFVDGTAAAGLDVENHRWTYAAAWADADRDGDMDLYVANDYGPNQYFINDGTGRFEDRAEALGAFDQANGMSVSWLDYDNDLDLDLYISNMQSFAGNRITRLENFPGTDDQRALYRRFSQGNTLLENDGTGRFVDATDEAGVRGAFWAWGSAPFDYDSDGDLDIFCAGGFYTGESTADT